jgi:hypothetical protein
MKHRIAFRLFIYIALLAGLPGLVGRASAQNKIPVTIPFAFVANHQSMPAGQYYVRMLTPHLMSLADGHTGITKTLLLVRPESEHNGEARGRLIFFHPGTRYWLTQVRIAGSSVHSELMGQPRLERELAGQAPTVEQTVEIALR